MENALPDTSEIAELRENLCRPLPELPTRYFYDDHGSALFQGITTLPEYYLDRTERHILQAWAPSLLDSLKPRHLVELGSGTAKKLRVLLDGLIPRGLPETCTLLDIHATSLEDSAGRLRRSYPGIEFQTVQANFLDEVYRLGPGGQRLILMLSGTLGTVHPDQVPGFLTMVAEVMEPGDAFLVGVDLVKDPGLMEAAYNDREGLTSTFNKNSFNFFLI